MLDRRFELKLNDEIIEQLEEFRKILTKAFGREVSLAEVIRMAIKSYSPQF